ncbi:MAG: hypothetical protein ACK40H_01920 [Sphingomonadaceae bacterium]
MAKVVVQFRSDVASPSIEAAARRLGIDPADIDPEFGVIETDPVARHYTVLVEAAVAAKAAAALAGSDDPAEGVFANPEEQLLDPDPEAPGRPDGPLVR